MEKSSNWVQAPDSPSLPAGEVHVWANLPRAAWRYVGSVSTILEAEELERAGRFRFERLQRHFVVSRFLRHVLGQYLEVKPSELRFTYNDYGKPSLQRELAVQHVAFA